MEKRGDYSREIITKVYFPRNVIIDRPGIIINKLSQKYSPEAPRKRIAYYFEDVFVRLQLNTINKLGEEKAKEFFYKVGKEIGARYMLLSKIRAAKQFPLSTIIESIFSNLRANGMSVCSKILFNRNRKTFILSGKDNIIWRKTKDGSIFGGIVSGIFSCLFNENLEAEDEFLEDETCVIFVNKNIKEKHVLNLKEIFPMKEYEKLNFPENIVFHNTPNLFSFSDLIKFNKISIKPDGKHYVGNRIIFPGEIGMMELISEHYKNAGEFSIFKDSVISESENIYPNIFESEGDIHKRLRDIGNLLSALGWGIPSCRFEKDKTFFTFIYPPVCKYGFNYLPFVLNGFINIATGKTHYLKKTKFKANPSLLNLEFKQVS